MGDIESFGADPRRIEYAGSTVPGVTINWKAKYQRSIEDLKGNYAYFEVPYNGKDNDDYVNGEGFCCSQNTALRAGIGIGNVNYEKMQYYYHPDHLGSSSYITNLDGEIVQHVEYVPFGEVFIEERNNSWNSPYLFNGKELDEETGLYYYGARYYNPRESVWLSVDPLAEKYPSISPYAYVANNPVNAIDPDGRVIIFINGQHAGDGGNRKYWNGLDQRIANRFNDYRACYYDGAMGGWKNTLTRWTIDGGKNNLWWSHRRNAGYREGYSQAAEIYANLKDGETIKIVTHSMGGAYGKGFINGLKAYAKENKLDARIERVLDLATFQGSSLQASEGVLNEQIAHTNDGIAGVSRINGINNENFHETRKDNKTGWLSEHSVDSFTQKEINENVVAGNPSTSQPSQDKKIKVDYQQKP